MDIVPKEWLLVQDFPSGILMTFLPLPTAVPGIGRGRESRGRERN